jgi:AbrB family looped-hinge helix DNA binding protein
MPAVKVGSSRQVAIPKKIFTDLGLAPGDYLEVERRGNTLVLTPKALIDKGLKESLEEARQGKLIGPFRTAKGVMRALKKPTA